MNEDAAAIIEERLTTLFSSLVGRVPEEILRRAEEDVRYREYGMALENLCQCMYDSNVTVTPGDLTMIGGLAADMGLGPERWNFLERLAESVDVDSAEKPS